MNKKKSREKAEKVECGLLEKAGEKYSGYVE